MVWAQQDWGQQDRGLYREGLPDVLTPPPAAAPIDNSVVERFRRAYAGRKSPRIVAFWNQEFDDQVSSFGNEEVRIRDMESFAVTGTWNGTAGVRDRTIIMQSGPSVVESARRPGFSETSAWAFEAAFSQVFAEAGAHLVDRATITRTTAARDRSTGRADQKRAEGAAVAEADLVMEVLVARDWRSPVGTAFKVAVKDVRSGRVLANVVTMALPPQRSTQQYAATNRGFVPVTSEVTVDQVGRQLAVETMVGLLGAWR